uniref:Lipoprotein n=1 Tax=uncultured bacterium contig00086 TaxID=1181559 RepID=A0A806KKI6_9BACT|nr:hypothetical protein [uncultured bacterium contig00086]
MKKTKYFKSIFLAGQLAVLAIAATGCFSSPEPIGRVPPPPRRLFESVDINGRQEPFIIDEYVSDGRQYRREAVFYSTALFLADAGKLENTSREQFEYYAEILFTDFPDYEQTKTIVIPDFADIDDSDSEKNAYVFITKMTNTGGAECYSMETNIPIASITNFRGGYNGYVMEIKSGFIPNKVPGSWVAVMSIDLRDDFLLYKGVAYPAKASPLYATETGIGQNTRMKDILEGADTIDTVKSKLIDMEDAIQMAMKSGNADEAEEAKFLDKFTNLSLAAYSYLETDRDEAIRYFNLSRNIDVQIPNRQAGAVFMELDKILYYLLFVVS